MILSNREEGCGPAAARGRFHLDCTMPKETEKQFTAPEACRECEHWQEITQQIRIAELLKTAIEGMQTRLTSGDFKPTLGDYLKLLQLEKEMEEGGPTEIKVTWVDPASLSKTGK